jgi:pyruvate dehydrogenase E1 component
MFTHAESVVVGVLEGLARDENIDPSVPIAAARQYKIDDVQAAPEQTFDPEVA